MSTELSSLAGIRKELEIFLYFKSKGISDYTYFADEIKYFIENPEIDVEVEKHSTDNSINFTLLEKYCYGINDKIFSVIKHLIGNDNLEEFDRHSLSFESYEDREFVIYHTKENQFFRGTLVYVAPEDDPFLEDPLKVEVSEGVFLYVLPFDLVVMIAR